MPEGKYVKTRGWILLSTAVVIVIAVFVAAYLSTVSFDTTLDFVVRDMSCGASVYGTEIQLQNRTIRGFFDTIYHFSHLDRGSSILKIEAPYYESVEVPVNLRRGRNILDEPIELMGLEIPELSHFYIMERIEDGQLISEVRPVAANGQAILNHPCLDIRMFVRISAQILDGAYSYEPSDEGAERGEELYTAELTPVWDASPGTIFRWTTRLPVEEIKQSRALYWVVDYLLLIPDPSEIGPTELAAIANELASKTTVEEWMGYLDTLEEALNFYLFPSWNVVAGG